MNFVKSAIPFCFLFLHFSYFFHTGQKKKKNHALMPHILEKIQQPKSKQTTLFHLTTILFLPSLSHLYPSKSL